jgi:hypothetical protein
MSEMTASGAQMIAVVYGALTTAEFHTLKESLYAK